MSDNPMWEIIQGDALKILSSFAPGTFDAVITCLLYTSPSPRDGLLSRMPSAA